MLKSHRSKKFNVPEVIETEEKPLRHITIKLLKSSDEDKNLRDKTMTN